MSLGSRLSRSATKVAIRPRPILISSKTGRVSSAKGRGTRPEDRPDPLLNPARRRHP